jgi:hypothetical protein
VGVCECFCPATGPPDIWFRVGNIHGPREFCLSSVS